MPPLVMTSLVRLPFGLEITIADLTKLILDKIFFGLIAGVALAIFGYWLNRRLKERDQAAERAAAALNIRVTIATAAVGQIQAMVDEILAALGYLKAEVFVLKRAAAELAERAPPPRPKLSPNIWLDEAWDSKGNELRSRIETVLSATRFIAQSVLFFEVLRRKKPEWALRVLDFDEQTFKDARGDIFTGDISSDIARLLVKQCLGAEAISKLEIPLAKLRAAVHAASIVLIVDDSMQDFLDLRRQLMKYADDLSTVVLDLRDAPELAGPLSLGANGVSEALNALIYGLVETATAVMRQQGR